MELEQIKGLLDLANLEDITAIKKAYAKQVKLIRRRNPRYFSSCRQPIVKLCSMRRHSTQDMPSK